MNEPHVHVGSLDIPEWQFEIYLKESEKFINLLEEELPKIRVSPVSKNLLRAIHTLSGTTNTIGIDLVAKIGQPLEAWLSHFVDTNPDQILNSEHIQHLEDAGRAIIEMVNSIRNKEYPEFKYQSLQEYLLMFMSEIDKTAEGSTVDTPKDADHVLDELLSFDDSLSEFSDIDSLLGDLAPVDKKEVELSLEPVQDTESSTEVPAEASSEIKSIVVGMLPDDSVVDDIDDSIKDIFLEEAVDIFEKMPKTIEKWISSGGQDAEHAGLIKRYLHTLKGSARMAGYIRFGAFVHNIETALDEGWSGLDVSDMPEMVQIASDAMAMEVEYFQHRSSSGFEHLRHGKSTTTGTITKTLVTDMLRVAPRRVETRTDLPVGFKDIMARTTDNVEEGVADTLKVPTVKIDSLSNHLGKNGTVQLRVESNVDRVEAQISEMAKNIQRLQYLLDQIEIQAETQMRSRRDEAEKHNSTFDPLEFDRFTRLQELTRMTNEAMGDITNSHSEISKSLVDIKDSIVENAIISDDMQHAVMSVRTIPVSSIKTRFDRLVRRSAAYVSKQVEIVFENELDIDSGVLNKVLVPMEHLIRNAIAHGIESPARRIELDKPQIGKVTLGVKMKGNDIVFRLQDDGGGINREAVQRKAREKGLIGPNEEITQEKANSLIFDPGFSTAEQVSSLAGRGVGMDVVQNDIAGMGGRIHVHSVSGVGTTFELIVPSYMSVISMVPVKSHKTTYAIPVTLVEDVVVVRDTLVLSAYETGILSYNDTDYEFYGLGEVDGFGPNDIQRNNRILLSRDGEKLVAVHIDNLEPDRNLVMKPLCRTIATLPGLMGSTVAGDGTPLLVINPVYLKASAVRQKVVKKDNVQKVVQKKTRQDTVVMVVDDSLTVRRISQKFLDREGFKTIVAKDGLDAIEKINEHGCPDIFLSDIEMPNMDGFQLAEHIRTAVSKTVPIIMISSRSIEKYAEHARSLGVNKSIGKPYQEPELLAAIEELTGLVSQ